jgi:hypothetical protein
MRIELPISVVVETHYSQFMPKIKTLKDTRY